MKKKTYSLLYKIKLFSKQISEINNFSYKIKKKKVGKSANCNYKKIGFFFLCSIGFTLNCNAVFFINKFYFHIFRCRFKEKN